MFPSGCPFLQHRLEPIEGLSQAVSCREEECPWFHEECTFIERLIELMIGPGREGTPTVG